MDEPHYDPKNRESILAYSKHLEGSSLREHVDVDEIEDPKKRRGAFGDAVEEYYFKLELNNESRPDFEEAGLELKCTPVKRIKSGELRAKERLVLGMIDYEEVVEEEFETSHLMSKVHDMLLITYLWEEDVEPLDYKVLVSDFWRFPEEDLPQIQSDWETVVEKVRDGRAHELSGSDTLFLEACTKAAKGTDTRKQPFSSVPAKPRAWALKASYMTAIQNERIDNVQCLHRKDDEVELDLLSLVRKRFEPFFGLTEEELANRFGIGRSKHRCARITQGILGVEQDAKIAEFEKAGIKPRTIRLKKNGRPKEAVSFPAFDYFDVVEAPFEDSDFYEYLQTRYLFVLYREDDRGEYRLFEVYFWQMPDDDLDEAQRCYEQMQQNIREGRADVSVKSSENRCCHVRPHGKNANDTLPTPCNGEVVKKCFWLNPGYLKDEIGKLLEK